MVARTITLPCADKAKDPSDPPMMPDHLSIQADYPEVK